MLVSGTNIKTIDGISILGSGDVSLESIREQIERNTNDIDVNTDRLNIEGTQVITVDEMINFNPIANEGNSYLAGYLDKPSRYVVTKEVGGVPVNVGILEILSDSSQHVYTQVFTTHFSLDNSGNLDLGAHDDTKLVTYFRSYSIDSPLIDSGTWTKWEDISHYSDIQESIEFLNANTGVSEYPKFSEAKAYAVGDIVLYEGLMYRFTSEHAAGAWDASQVVAWSERKEVDGKIGELSSKMSINVIPRSSDLNTFISHSVNAMYNQIEENGYINSPVKVGDRGLLLVYSNNDGTVVYQTITTIAGYIYTRSRSNETFSEWVEHKPSDLISEEISIANSQLREDIFSAFTTLEQYRSIAKGAVFPETYVVDIDLENLKLKTGRFGFIVSGDTEYHRISDGETSFNNVNAGIAFIFFDESDKMLHLYAYNETYNKKGLFAGILYFYNGSIVDYWICWSGIKINGQPIGEVFSAYGTNVKSAISQKFFTDEINKLKEQINASPFAGKKLSIMGDSISTFSGHIPSGNAVYYPNGDITDVRQTWWKKLLDKTGMTLEVNNSWSGSRLTNGRGESSMFNAESRYGNLGNPDIIMVFGGTNDFWQGNDHAKLGEYNLSVTATKDLQYFKQAYQNLIEKLQTNYPNAVIYILVPIQRDLSYFTKNNEGWSLQELWNTCREIGDMYAVNVIDLSKCGINYYNYSQYLVDGTHPKESGMELICDYIYRHL